MKLLYNSDDGEIFYAVYDADSFKFTHTTNIPLSEFVIDEVDPDNKEICLDVSASVFKKDINGLGKYYIEIYDGMLTSRDNWQEHNPMMEMPE